MEKLEYKAALEVSEAGEITGNAWPFDSADSVGDVITKDAISSPARLPMLFSHDRNQVIGIWDSITATDEGLQVKGRLLIDDVVRAREVRALVREGAVTGLSIGFMGKKMAPRRGGGRLISALELHEISIVPVPSHSGARIITAKQANIKEGHLPEIEQAQAPDLAAIEKKFADLEAKALDASKIGQRLDQIEKLVRRPANANISEEKKGALETKAFINHIRGVQTDEVKALTIAAPGTAGVLVPPEYSSTILQRITEINPIRALAGTPLRMTSNLIEFPRLVNDVDPDAVPETGTRPEKEPTFDQIDLRPFEMSVIVPISTQAIEDNAVSLETWIGNYLATRYALKESNWFLTGNGTSEAEGILTSNQVNIFQGGAAIDADSLIDFYYSLQTVYAKRGAFIANRKTIAKIRKLKDNDGAYLWQNSLAAGQPATLLGAPVYEAEGMPDVAAGATPLLFGDIASGYLIADRVDFSFDKDGITGFSQGITKYNTRRRVGGRVIDGAALAKFKMAAA